MRARRTTLLTAALAALVATALSPTATAVGDAGGRQVTGTLLTVVHDDFTHHRDTTTTYLVRDDGTRLELADAGGLPAQGTVTGTLPPGVSAATAGPVRLVDREVVPASATVTPRAHHAYVAAMTNMGPQPTEADLRTLVGDALDYWVEQSDGVVSSFDLAGATYYSSTAATDPGTSSCGLGTGTGAVWTEAADLFPGVDFNAAGNHLIVLVPSACVAGGTVGLASIGSSLGSGGSVLADTDPGISATTLTHELGHNLSLNHANAESCHDGSCNTEQYADAYDVMGYAVSGSAPALNSVHRADLGLLTAAESPEVRLPVDQDTATTGWTLTARGLTSGRRSLTIVDPDDLTTYQVDYRAVTGRDTGAFWTTTRAGIGVADGTIFYGPGIAVTADANAKYSVLHAQAGVVPPGANYWEWPSAAGEGETWTSASGAISIHVDDLRADAADVSVTLHSDLPASLPQGEPVLTGTPAVGSTLSLDVGTWAPEASYSTDWLIDGSAPLVPVFDDFSLELEPYMRGAIVQAVVTVTVPDHRPQKRVTVPVGPITWPVDVTVALSSTDPQVGVPVTASVSTDPGGGVPTAYRWLRDGTAIPGATAASYTPVVGDVGRRLSLEVTTSGAGGRDAGTGTSPLSAPVLPEPFRAGTPTLSAAPTVGVPVAAVTGDWSPGTTFGYQWLRGGTPIAGATAASYTPTGADAGASLQVAVTGTRGADTATRTSPGATVQRGVLSGPAPTLTGKARVGKRLAVGPGTWPPGTVFTYEWLVDGQVVKSGPATFKLKRKHLGHRVSVRVTAALPGYGDAVATSAAKKVKRRR